MSWQSETNVNAQGFNKTLYSLMAARHLTPDDIADLANITSKTVWNMLHGRVSPRVDTAQRVASVLGVSLDTLYPCAKV